jgi:hypothetical protein
MDEISTLPGISEPAITAEADEDDGEVLDLEELLRYGAELEFIIIMAAAAAADAAEVLNVGMVDESSSTRGESKLGICGWCEKDDVEDIVNVSSSSSFSERERRESDETGLDEAED